MRTHLLHFAGLRSLCLSAHHPTCLPAACSTVAGVIYPAYASFKAVQVLTRRRTTEEAEKWLTYWAVYASFSVVERLLDKALPW